MLMEQALLQFKDAGPYWEIDSEYNWVLDDLENEFGEVDVRDQRPLH